MGSASGFIKCKDKTIRNGNRKQQSDIRSQAEQRMDDLELLQRALSTVQYNKIVSEHLQNSNASSKNRCTSNFSSNTKMDNQMTSLTLDNTDLKRKAI